MDRYQVTDSYIDRAHEGLENLVRNGTIEGWETFFPDDSDVWEVWECSNEPETTT